jgi:hypothetical protein
MVVYIIYLIGRYLYTQDKLTSRFSHQSPVIISTRVSFREIPLQPQDFSDVLILPPGGNCVIFSLRTIPCYYLAVLLP